MSRATKAYVSAYDRSRVHQSTLYRFERRRYVAAFNGLLAPGVLIECMTWRTDSPEIGVISNPQISEDRRECSVLFAAQLGGWTNMRCEITTTDGGIYNQVYRVNVREASWFFNDPPTQPGPFSVGVCVEPEPPVPPVLEVTSEEPTFGDVTIEWMAAEIPGQTIASYQIYRLSAAPDPVFGDTPDFSELILIDVVAGNVVTFDDDGLDLENFQYAYGVRAIGSGGGQADSNIVLTSAPS